MVRVIWTVATALLMSVVAEGDLQQSRVHRLRDFSRIATLQPGAPVEAAAKLHGQLIERGRAIRGLAALTFGTAAGRSCQPTLEQLGPLLGGASSTWTAQWNQTAVVSPVDFGADPTGQLDSSAAMSAAMNRIAKLCEMQSGHLSFNVTYDPDRISTTEHDLCACSTN